MDQSEKRARLWCRDSADPAAERRSSMKRPCIVMCTVRGCEYRFCENWSSALITTAKGDFQLVAIKAGKEPATKSHEKMRLPYGLEARCSPHLGNSARATSSLDGYQAFENGNASWHI